MARDMIKTGQAWLARQLKEHLSQSATYRRGSTSIAIQVTVGRTLDGLGMPFGGAQIRRIDKDFIATAADLTLGVPISGDWIDIDEQGVTHRYQVVQPDEGVPVSEPVDAYGYQIRIHAKLLKAL